MENTRKLTTIFYADVAGYSRLTGTDEIGTHKRVMTALDGATAQITEGGGQVLRYAGDAILATFDSVSNAVETAISIQNTLRNETADLMEQERVLLRIGINIGDVIHDRGEVYGDGVNLAARLEATAQPGGLCVSDAVYGQVSRNLIVEFSDGGTPSLKNIERPIRVWHWPPVTAKQDQIQGTEVDIPAVAVLPFDNMSGNDEDDYFSDGLTEDIITALSQWRSIPVIARNSVFTYKNQAVKIQDVANELGVQYVIEGSVRRAGNRIRINVQLIDALNGHHVWAERYDRQLDDVFAVQDEITSAVASTIVPEIRTSEVRRVTAKGPQGFDAWDFYLRGMATFYEQDRESLNQALENFTKATEADPNYAEAWAMRAWVHAKRMMLRYFDNADEEISHGFVAGRKAITIDEASPVANLALGSVHIWAGETDKGLARALRALELNPNYVPAMLASGNRLDLVGRGDEGVEIMERAIALSPRDPNQWRYLAYLSRTYLSAGDLDRAAECSQRAIALRPNIAEAQFRHAICLAHLDRIDEARSALEKCHQIDPTYIDRKSPWQPYPDQSRNDFIMSAPRRHGLLT